MAKTGRPSKGDRVLVTGRIPARHDELLRDLALERGLYRSDLVAACIAVALTHLDELPTPLETPQELPLTS